MEESIYTDYLGRAIRIGDYIAYAVRDGNSGNMKFGKVQELANTKNGTNAPVLKVKAMEKLAWRKNEFVVCNGGRNVTIGLGLALIVEPNGIPDNIKQILE